MALVLNGFIELIISTNFLLIILYNTYTNMIEKVSCKRYYIKLCPSLVRSLKISVENNLLANAKIWNDVSMRIEFLFESTKEKHLIVFIYVYNS